MQSSQSRTIGLALAAFGGLVLTVDIPLIRLGNGDVWSVMAVRAICTLVSGFGAWWLYRRITGRDVQLVPGWQGVGVGLGYAASSLFFIAAVHMTPTANLVFILALNPMISALRTASLMSTIKKSLPVPFIFVQTRFDMALNLFGF